MSEYRKKFAISTNVLTKFTLLDALGMIAGSGFRGAEILADKPHAYFPEVTDTFIDRLNIKREKLRLIITNINANTASGYFDTPAPDNFEPSLINPDENLRSWRVQYSIDALNFAKKVDARNISITSGIKHKSQKKSEAWDLLLDSLNQILEEADKLEINVGIEYEPGLLVGSCKDLMKLFDDLKHPRLGANLDVGHAVVCGEDISNTVNLLGDKIYHVHLEDIRGKEHFHLLPGFGDIHFPDVINEFSKIDYKGFLTWELYTYKETPREALYITRAYINEALQ